MALHHIGILKAVSWTYSITIGAVFFAMDPTTKSFLYALTIAVVPQIILGLFTLRKLQSISVNVDGKLGRLLEQKDVLSKDLAGKSDELSHAQGRREGIESTESKP